MKRIIIILIGLLIYLNTHSQQQIVSKVITYDLNIKVPNFRSMNSSAGIASYLLWSVSGTLNYKIGNTEHLISNPSDTFPSPPFHFIKRNNKWESFKYYSNALMNGARNYAFIDSNGSFAYVTSGTENEWNAGDVYVCYTKNDSLNWQKISNKKMVFEDVAVGDINQDGKTDIISAGFTNPNLRPYIQTKDGLFEEDLNYIKYIKSSSSNSLFDNIENTGNAVAIDDLNNDGIPEIIRGQYTSSPEGRYGIAIHHYNKISKIYDSTYFIPELGIFNDLKVGSTSIKITDLNNDGYKDIIVATETINMPGYNTIQSYINDGKGKFKFNQTVKFDYDTLQFREFIIFDFNKDGWKDIILNPSISIPTSSNLFRLKNSTSEIGRRIHPIILINKNSFFDTLNYPVEIKGIFPAFLKASIIDNNLKFISFSFPNDKGMDPLVKRDANNNVLKDSIGNPILLAPDSVRIIEIEIIYCKDLIKPTFNTTKYSFCSGDSLKLSITNINKGDSLKWYFGTKSDLTNIANKTFTDSTKLFVTRTDSVGCMISSDTVQIKKYSIPASPNLSRDADNNLVSNATGNNWYKDGVKITDTTQKIKPTTNGIYTATTTQNGCTSSISQGYYYLTNAVNNLSNGEYFKISPNPTSGELNINYRLLSDKEVYFSVMDMNGRNIILNRKIISGTKINLGAVSKGNYIVQVKDKTGRLITTQKLVKE